MPIMLIQVNKCFLLYCGIFQPFSSFFSIIFSRLLIFLSSIRFSRSARWNIATPSKSPRYPALICSSYYFRILIGFTANLCKEWKSWIEQQFFVYCRLRLEVQVELNIDYDLETSDLTYLGPIWAQRLDVPTTCIYQQKLAGIWTIILKYNWSALTANLVFGLTCWLVMWEL